ncbi:hypothetical protein AACI63_001068 [Escherichia coli]
MPEHDDEHCNGELAMAAVCYINETGTVNRNGGKPWGWPWDASWWKPNARRRNLVKAGALILAEIERIDRAAGIGKGELCFNIKCSQHLTPAWLPALQWLPVNLSMR